jgi:hypothetical protein
MLMPAAVRMDSTTSPPPPWFPVPAGSHRLPYDITAAASAPPSPAPATAAAAPPPRQQHHQRRLPAARRVASKRRRPRPSRKLPTTTYVTAADPASFRRMVHQATGADDLPAAAAAPLEALSCRPAPPHRASGAMVLPTLDTSASFLIGAPARTDAPCAATVGSARPPAPALNRSRPEACGGGGCSNYSSSCCGSGFPTLDPWDDALF